MRLVLFCLLLATSLCSGAFALSAQIFLVDPSLLRDLVLLRRATVLLGSSTGGADFALDSSLFEGMGEGHGARWRGADAAARAFSRRVVSFDLEGRRSVALLEGFSRVWGDLREEVDRVRLELSSRYGERLSSIDRRLLFVDLSSSDREALLRERASLEREMASERMRRTVSLVEGRLRELEKGLSSLSSPFAAPRFVPMEQQTRVLDGFDLSGAGEFSGILLRSLSESARLGAARVEGVYLAFLSGVIELALPSDGASRGAPLVLLRDDRLWYFDESLCVDLTPRLYEILDGGVGE